MFDLEVPQEFQRYYKPGFNSIVKFPSEILRKKSNDVILFNIKLRELINKMIKAMKENSGVGISAPQLGVNQNIIIIKNGEKPIEFINPIIVTVDGPIIEMEEGCLSIPCLFGFLQRPDQVVIRAKNKHGKPFQIKLTGLSARVAQHEIDHLGGILFIDRVNKTTLNWKNP